MCSGKGGPWSRHPGPTTLSTPGSPPVSPVTKGPDDRGGPRPRSVKTTVAGRAPVVHGSPEDVSPGTPSRGDRGKGDGFPSGVGALPEFLPEVPRDSGVLKVETHCKNVTLPGDKDVQA